MTVATAFEYSSKENWIMASTSAIQGAKAEMIRI